MKYVGARYVPKFEGTYDATQAYENMTVVDNGMGTSYISRKPVPAGTPLTDFNYWAVYGASNGAIINLQNQIDTLDHILTLAGSKILFVMDSYGTRVNSDGKKVNEIIGDNTGAVTDIIASPGAAIYGGSILAAFNAYAGDYTEFDTVVFIGGANDESVAESNYNDIVTGIGSLITAIRTNCTNCKRIFVACPGLTFGSYTKTRRQKLFGAYKEGALKNGAIYIDNSQYILCNTTLLENDKVHPNAAGVDALAYYVQQGITSGSCDVHYQITPTLTKPDSSTANYLMIRHNAECAVYADSAAGWLYLYAPSDTYNGSQKTLGTFSDTLVDMRESMGKSYINGVGYVVTTPVKVAYFIQDGTFYAHVTNVDGSAVTGNAFKILSNFVTID